MLASPGAGSYPIGAPAEARINCKQKFPVLHKTVKLEQKHEFQ